MRDRDSTTQERVPIDRHAQRGADLVLAPVAPANGPRNVVIAHRHWLEELQDLLGKRQERVFFRQGQDSDLVRSNSRVEAQQRPLLAGNLVNGVRGEQEGHHRAGDAGGRLDHIGHVALSGGGVEILEHLATRGRMSLEVEIGPVGNALELSPAPREGELDIGRPR